MINVKIERSTLNIEHPTPGISVLVTLIIKHLSLIIFIPISYFYQKYFYILHLVFDIIKNIEWVVRSPSTYFEG